jgi:hypothetical protein
MTTASIVRTAVLLAQAGSVEKATTLDNLRTVVDIIGTVVGLLRCANLRHAEAPGVPAGQIAKASSSKATTTRRFAGASTAKLVVASPDVLDEGVPGDHDPGVAVLLEPSHRSKPRLQAAMVGLDPVVRILFGAMPRCRQQLLQHHRVGRCLVGDDLHRRHLRGADGPFEEPAGCHRVTPRGHEHVNDLADLINRPVHVLPPASDLHVRLVHEAAASHGVPARASRLGQQRREPLHPPVHGDMVDLDPALGEQLFNVAVGQPKRRYQRTARTTTSGGSESQRRQTA